MPRNPYYNGPVSDHFDGERFFLKGQGADKSRKDMLRWQLSGRDKPAWPAQFPSPFQDKPPHRVEGSALRVVLVGHASVLIQTQGINLLIDPVWARRASPVQWAGPARVNAPGIALNDLPPLDAILISHNHYDHLDLTTLIPLARAHKCPVLTPLGNDTIIRKADAAIEVQAFDWGERTSIGPLTIYFTPARHWSARGLRDRRMALWSAFVIETAHGAIYHVADTSYGDGTLFPAIARDFGPVRLAILPIGAYEPRWFMRESHVDPDESVQIFHDCGAHYALAHHWGTFRLTDEAIDEPPARLAQALAKAGIAPERFRVTRPGEVFDVPEIAPAPRG